ncbi:MAG: ABC transporter ATP-binding protein [Clostridiales bacterium]|nr:ABC transporter ATP-binding protein [Clostridiales bacterium]
MLLEIEKLSGGYGGADIVKGVSWEADAGEIVCLVGPNGCGKTTMFRLILGMIKASGGHIKVSGKFMQSLSAKEMANTIAYIPQYHTPVFAFTVLDIVLMGRASYISSLEEPKAQDREAAFAALEKLGVAHLANRRYTSLSGGQKQMILIARAICQSAKIFVMDEPGASLDYANQHLLMQVITELAGEGYCVVMSTHSPEHPLSVGDKVVLMHEGRLAAFGKPEDVIKPDILDTIYGIEMDVVTLKDRYGADRTVCLPVAAPILRMPATRIAAEP